MLTWNEVPFSGHEFFEAEMLDEKEDRSGSCRSRLINL